MVRGQFMEEVRYQKEADFHNSAYSEKLREGTWKYYDALDHSRSAYQEYLRTHCKGAHVLEYGCGQNSLGRYLARHGAAEIVGIDISEVAVQQAQEVASSHGCDIATYQVMNCENLTFPQRTFDLTCGVAILHHLNLQKGLSEIARTLRPNGSAVFREPLAYNPLVNLYRRVTPKIRTEDEHPLSMEDLAMAEKYFQKVEIRYFNLFVLLGIPFVRIPGFNRIIKILDAADRYFLGRLGWFRKYAWTVLIVLSQPRPVPSEDSSEEKSAA